MLTGDWVYVAALAASFTIATVARPAGVSGAVLLLPFQVSVHGTPSPGVTPTNLLYTNDHGLGFCIWEGESVDAVREVVEGAVGPWANNEYYEMQVDGLTPQLGK